MEDEEASLLEEVCLQGEEGTGGWGRAWRHRET